MQENEERGFGCMPLLILIAVLGLCYYADVPDRIWEWANPVPTIAVPTPDLRYPTPSEAVVEWLRKRRFMEEHWSELSDTEYLHCVEYEVCVIDWADGSVRDCLLITDGEGRSICEPWVEYLEEERERSLERQRWERWMDQRMWEWEMEQRWKEWVDEYSWPNK